jgi:sec-independent protein translocase protein TatC
MAERMMSFGDHLEELRKRLKYAFYAVILCTLVAYGFSEFLFAMMAQPLIEAWTNADLGNPQLHFANPIEPFFTFLKLSLMVGIFASSPVIFYQLWSFVAPGLYRKERRYGLPFAVLSGLFFTGGASFGYFLVFPFAFEFFLGFAKANMGSLNEIMGQQIDLSDAVKHTFKLTPTLMMSEYFGLVWRLLLAFGLVFELPLFIFFLSMAGVVSYQTLWRFNRYFVVLSFVVGAMLTPPDIITQVLMATPLLILYNLAILLSWIFFRKKYQVQKDDADGAETPESESP